MGREDRVGRLSDARLCVVTDRGIASPRDLLGVIRAILNAGTPMLQLREKGLSDAEFLGLARAVRLMTRETGALLIVNDRPEVAAQADADGVHVGQRDVSVSDARRIVGAHRLVGLSVENVDQALGSPAADADYLGVGPLFPTPTKTDAAPPTGLGIFRELRKRGVKTPVYAIGGVSLANADAILEAGAWGLAVVSAVMAAPDPAASVKAFLEILVRHPADA